MMLRPETEFAHAVNLYKRVVELERKKMELKTYNRRRDEEMLLQRALCQFSIFSKSWGEGNTGYLFTAEPCLRSSI